jgi:amino acid adenylation domain-containing protein
VAGAALGPDDECYAYFTSGSTGRPKAIVGRLKALDHFVSWHLATFGIGPGDRMCQVTSFAFDGFLHEALVPLATGGTLCVSSDRETLLDGGKLAAWLERAGVHLIHCTPSLFRTMLNQDLDPERLPELRYALLVGEPLLPSDVERWTGVFGERIPLVNLYGPTETTLTKFVYFVKPEDAKLRTIPIGQPMPGARAIVVSDKGEPCPPGKLGEIYIRTPYRSLGYFEEPELTAEVFIPNPFGGSADDVVYKTGDLGRVREDGDFEFAGRRDHQVKVRGVRIELAPIQSLLSGHPAVEEAAVVARDDSRGNKYLCAYLVLEEKLDPNVLRDFLLEELPESSVPAAFVEMDELPRTLSGKLDTRALPDPDEGGRRLRREYVAPRTPTEEKICEIFSDLLKVPKVGVHDHFFELGGHSLLVMQLLARVRSSLVEIPLGQVFQTPTVEELALAVTRIELERAGEPELEELVDQLGEASGEELEELLREEGAQG